MKWLATCICKYFFSGSCEKIKITNIFVGFKFVHIYLDIQESQLVSGNYLPRGELGIHWIGDCLVFWRSWIQISALKPATTGEFLRFFSTFPAGCNPHIRPWPILATPFPVIYPIILNYSFWVTDTDVK